MIENYIKDSFGVIHQKKIKKIKTYDKTYIEERYYQYKDKCIDMSYLRFGYITGSIKKIPDSILDVGYGSGDFLNVCKEIIPNCYGNDITGVDIPNNVTFVKDILQDFYEVITFFDVLEHFEDINFIDKLKCKYVCISVPWCHYLNDDWFLNWKHRRPDEHLHHFNLESLKNFFENNGYILLNFSNIEDIIRKDKNIEKNILTCVFEKK